ncbi:MAG TPA: Mrp/NBP35 family ATP-binding protein [Candidatus Thermoplasmatota archaeon]|nr:Mrp/NBP35 family ATP-binding protein [Candidatus Thermoplasmatota archaeon]
MTPEAPHAPLNAMNNPMGARMAEELARRTRISKNLGRIRHKVVVMSGKGGVGKTTVSVNLAASLAKRGFQVGVLDMDITGPDVPLMLGVEGRRLDEGTGMIQPILAAHGIRIMSISFLLPTEATAVVWRGPMKMHALTQFLGDVEWGDLDFLVIDLPPGTSDEPLSVAQSIRDIDGVVIVTTPQTVSTLDVKKALGFAKTLKLRVLGVIENMSGFDCPHCGSHYAIFGKEGGGKQLAEDSLAPFLGAIPLDPLLVERGDTGRPFVWDLPDSPAAQKFEAAVKELLRLVNEPDEKQVASAQ